MDIKKLKASKNQRVDICCTHPAFMKEFIRGAPTGNYICINCGQHLSYILSVRE